MEVLFASVSNVLYASHPMTQGDNAPATKGDLNAMKEEILRHFDVTVENIRHDLEGANRDEIEVLQDARTDHEQRVAKLEQVTGLRA